MVLNDMVRGTEPMEPQARESHPTRDALLAVCHQLLDERRPEEILLQDVLVAAGVTKGALYHHFTDFSELIETALIERFARYVDDGIAAMQGLLHSCNSRDDLLAALAVLTVETQRPERRTIRLSRAHVLTVASSNPRMSAALAGEQQRLTAGLTDLIGAAQHRGWFNNDFDPAAGAVLIQAYTLGRIVDDVSAEPIDPDSWVRLIHRLIERVFA